MGGQEREAATGPEPCGGGSATDVLLAVGFRDPASVAASLASLVSPPVVVEVAGGYEALEARARLRPDALLVDLGDGSGCDLVLLLELVLLSRSRPVLAIGPASLRAAALRSGAAGFLAPDAMAERLAPLLEKARLSSSLYAACDRVAAHDAATRGGPRDGVLVVSRSGRILEVNDVGLAIVGYERPDAIYHDIFASELRWSGGDGRTYSMGESPPAVAMRTGEPVEPVLQVIELADGTVRYVECSASPLFYGDEPEPYGAVGYFHDVTSAQESHGAKLAAARREALLLEHAAEAYLVLDESGRVVDASPSVGQFWPLEWIYGRDARELVHAGDRAEADAILSRLFASGGEPVRVELRVVDAWGGRRVVEVTLSDRRREPAIRGVVLNVRDVTERHELELERRRAEERFRLGFERTAVGMLMYEFDGRITRVNAALCEMGGWTEEELVGSYTSRFVHPDDLDAHRAALAAHAAGERDEFRVERKLVRRDGAVLWTITAGAVIREGPDGAGYVFSQIQDISDRRRTEQELEQQALHDALTGLPNRLALERRLTGALRRAGASGGRVAVLFVDLDRFKLVNDGLGHAVGDRLLVEVARRLGEGMREGDGIARFGGDEFLVVCEGVAGEEEARSLGERVLALVREPFVVDGMELHLTVSCGIALVGGETTAEEVLRDADAAMYRAKERGRARTELFDEGVRLVATRRLSLDQQLRVALERGELVVAYQPLVTLPEEGLSGVEALVRWNHPERGLVPPAEFVPVAEESGLIGAIGEFVLTESLAQVARWRRALPGCADLWVAVNFSPRQLAMGDPVGLCARALDAAGLPAPALGLELTESAVMADVESSVERLEGLRKLGVRLAIDDFGTGYSSLSYLSRLPVGALKLDRSFVADIDDPGGASTIVRAVLLLASGLGVKVCAEGVETVSQRDALVALGCRFAQGYLWSRPLLPDDFERLLFARPGVLRPDGVPPAPGRPSLRPVPPAPD